jgi:HEAT repeat protein/tetratricopeptide (TPR) repeat protein
MGRFSSILLIAVLGSSCAAAASASDPWRPGARLDEWQRIETLQRYPAFGAEPKPDWAALCRDPSPVVRAAAALAVGREADPKLIPLVEPLLDDPWPTARRCALWALLQMESPRAKAPLLKVLAEWPRPADGIAGTYNAELFRRIGLPVEVVMQRLERRRAWVKAFNADAWDLGIRDHYGGRRSPDLFLKVLLCPERSEFDSGESLRISVRAFRRDDGPPPAVGFRVEVGGWSSVDPEGGMADSGWYDQPPRFPDAREPNKRIDLQIGLPQAAEAQVTVLIRQNPGVYYFGGLGATCPFFVRVRRSEASEKTIPDLLARLEDTQAIQTLAQQRVQAAVEPLIDLFRRRGAEDGPIGVATARALARLADPAAVSVLLDRPELHDRDVHGSTSRALGAFGNEAWPEYEKRILSWREQMAAGKSSGLALSLGLLGPHGSDAVDRERLRIIRELVSEVGKGNAQQQWKVLDVLQAAVRVAAPQHPDEVADGIWSTTDRPNVCTVLLGVLRDPNRDGGMKRVAAALWNRARTAADLPPEIRRAIQQVVEGTAPELLAEMSMPILSAEEALGLLKSATLQLVERKEDAPQIRKGAADRLEAFLRGSQTAPSRRLRLGMSLLYYQLGRFEESAAQARQALAAEGPDAETVYAHYSLGRALLAIGKTDEAEAALMQADGLARPNAGNAGAPFDYITKEGIQGWLKRIAAIPRVAGLAIRQVRMPASIQQDGVVAVAGGRSYYVDEQQRLRVWDPMRCEGAVLGTMPGEVRDLVPFKGGRLFVAFKNGAVAVYEPGREGLVWKKPFALGSCPHLSASAAAVTAADEAGVLHVMDPASGKVLWTRQVQEARPSGLDGRLRLVWRTTPIPVRQRDDWLLVAAPDGTVLECVESATGKSRWQYRPSAPGCLVAIGDGVLVVLAKKGEVTAVSLRDGSPLWRAALGVDTTMLSGESALAPGPADKRVYVAAARQVWVLDGSTGNVVGRWDWIPRHDAHTLIEHYPPRAHVVPVAGGAYCLWDWASRQNGTSHRTDVVFIGEDGRAGLHEQCPGYDSGRNAFAVGQTLAFRRGGLNWNLWRFEAPR